MNFFKRAVFILKLWASGIESFGFNKQKGRAEPEVE